jgi:hypothetical protein
MKILIALAAAVGLLAFSAQAQIGTASPSAVVKNNVVTNAAVYFIPGSTTTNIPVTAARWLPIPKGGVFGLFLLGGATNAASTTNATFTFEGLILDRNNRTQVVDNVSLLFKPAYNGTSRASQNTNFLSTDRNIAGLDAIRLKSIQNTNDLGIFVTNLFQTIP